MRMREGGLTLNVDIEVACVGLGVLTISGTKYITL